MDLSEGSPEEDAVPDLGPGSLEKSAAPVPRLRVRSAAPDAEARRQYGEVSLPAQSRSGRAIKRKVEWEPPTEEKRKRVRGPGRGVQLGSLECFEAGLKKETPDSEVLRRLHNCLYETFGQHAQRKASLRRWDGDTADDAEERLLRRVRAMQSVHAKAVARLCGLPASGARSDLDTALADFLQEPKAVVARRAPRVPAPKWAPPTRSHEAVGPASEDDLASSAGDEPPAKAAPPPRPVTAPKSRARPPATPQAPPQAPPQGEPAPGHKDALTEFVEQRRPVLRQQFPGMAESDITTLIMSEWQGYIRDATAAAEAEEEAAAEDAQVSSEGDSPVREKKRKKEKKAKKKKKRKERQQAIASDSEGS